MDLIDLIPKIDTIQGLDPNKVYFIELAEDITRKEAEEIYDMFERCGLKIVMGPANMITIRGDPNENQS